MSLRSSASWWDPGRVWIDGGPTGIRTQDTRIKSLAGERSPGRSGPYCVHPTRASRPSAPPPRTALHRRGCQRGCQHAAAPASQGFLDRQRHWPGCPCYAGPSRVGQPSSACSDERGFAVHSSASRILVRLGRIGRSSMALRDADECAGVLACDLSKVRDDGVRRGRKLVGAAA